eukprot:m.267221 g.267221  ORF g.267221 m.267221 type:complete len:152 (-) comp32730_c0_seq1:27-482(-)
MHCCLHRRWHRYFRPQLAHGRPGIALLVLTRFHRLRRSNNLESRDQRLFADDYAHLFQSVPTLHPYADIIAIMERIRPARDRARDSKLERERARRIASLFSVIRQRLDTPDATREELLEAMITHIESSFAEVLRLMALVSQRAPRQQAYIA